MFAAEIDPKTMDVSRMVPKEIPISFISLVSITAVILQNKGRMRIKN